MTTKNTQTEYTPFNPCPYCGNAHVTAFIVTESIVQGDGKGGIIEQDRVAEWDVVKIYCEECETELFYDTEIEM